MPHVMIMQGFPNGQASDFDGWYLKSFDFEAHNGQGLIDMTQDLGQAKKFKNLAEVHTFYKTQPKCKPLRDDLEPNRPLTAANWEIRHVD